MFVVIVVVVIVVVVIVVVVVVIIVVAVAAVVAFVEVFSNITLFQHPQISQEALKSTNADRALPKKKDADEDVFLSSIIAVFASRSA
jgi:hypothetical protein